jgi:hypothetical protein
VQVMAQFYGLPLASLRAAAWRHMLEGKNGFNVSSARCSWLLGSWCRHAMGLYAASLQAASLSGDTNQRSCRFQRA